MMRMSTLDLWSKMFQDLVFLLGASVSSQYEDVEEDDDDFVLHIKT